VNRSVFKKPCLGIVGPWIIVILIVFLLHQSVPCFDHVRSAILVIFHETLRNYPQAAVEMGGWNAQGNTGLDSWRKDLFRSAGMSSFLSGRFFDAVHWFGRIVHSEDINGRIQWDYFALIYRGISYYKIGHYDLAREDWTRAFLSIPGRHDAFIVIGHSRLLEGDLISAYAHYLRALEHSGRLGPVYADIGDAWRHAGRLTCAANWYRKGQDVDPSDVFCRLRLAELALVIDNDPVSALQASAQIRTLMPNLHAVGQIESAAREWTPGKQLEHIPAARFAPGPAHKWKVSPTRLYFEFFREDWNGW
jgi:tetratricopeptide (TPR) repeat protein